MHADWLDMPMFIISGQYIWLGLYAFIVIWFLIKYKIQGGVIILCAIVCVALSDQITSAIMKPFFERLRPSHDPTIMDTVHIVNDYRGGLFGFASSHAANSFALATFLWLGCGNREKWTAWLFLWAALVSYSRIYLGVHFPGDILTGAIVGIAIAWGVHFILKKLSTRYAWARFNTEHDA